MLLFIIELFPILALTKSPFLSVSSCNFNQTFVINRDHGAVCNNDESYINNSIQYMISRKKFYEFVPNNISESQEFVCKVNSMQYSDVLFVDTNMTKDPQSAIPIVCHVPEVAEDFYTDVEVWNYNPYTNTADLMKIVDTTEPSATEWNEYIHHVQFSRSENIAGLKGDYGSTVLRWDDAPYNPCGNCSATTNGLVFNNTFKSENYCLLRENYCVYSDSVNCTSSFGGACFDSSALTAPAPPPRLPPPPFPPGLAPPPVETISNYFIHFRANNYKAFSLLVNETIDLSSYSDIPAGTTVLSFFNTIGQSQIRVKSPISPLNYILYPGSSYWMRFPQDYDLNIVGTELPTRKKYTENFAANNYKAFGLVVNNTVDLSTYSDIPAGTTVLSYFNTFGQSQIRVKSPISPLNYILYPGSSYWMRFPQDYQLVFFN